MFGLRKSAACSEERGCAAAANAKARYIGMAKRHGDRLRGHAEVQRGAGVKAIVENFPLEKATEAYARMMSGKARFRVVLEM